MRLPYLQVTQETWTRARELAALLAVDRHRAIALILDLWAWGLELGPSDGPPTGELRSSSALRRMAGALEWPTNKAVELAEALQEVGLLDWDTDGTIERVRVRGLGRYREAWEKAERSRKRKAEWRAGLTPVPGTSPGQDADGPPETQTQTQKKTQTQIKKEEEGEKPPPTPAPQNFPVAVVRPSKSSDLWDGQDFWAWAQSVRQEGGFVAEAKPRGVDAWFNTALMTEGVSIHSLKEAFYAFGEDKHWEAKRYPFQAFMSQWRSFTRKDSSHGASAQQ